MKLYMIRTVRLSIIRSLFTVHSAMVYVIQVCRQLSSRSICSCSKAVWWTDELSETCRVSWQNKFGKLLHLVGFTTKKDAYLTHTYSAIPSLHISTSFTPYSGKFTPRFKTYSYRIWIAVVMYYILVRFKFWCRVERKWRTWCRNM